MSSDRLRMAIGRACRDAGVPVFAPHSLRHRYISLAHKQGDSWAEIGERVGQRSRLVTADRYSHALVDYRPVNRSELLERVRTVPPLGGPSEAGTCRLAGAFRASTAHDLPRNRLRTWVCRTGSPRGTPRELPGH